MYDWSKSNRQFCLDVSRRNYRNEFTSRYDNQRNVNTSFYSEFKVFFFVFVVEWSRRDVRLRIHPTYITHNWTDDNKNKTLSPLLHTVYNSCEMWWWWRWWWRRSQFDKQWAVQLLHKWSLFHYARARNLKLNWYICLLTGILRNDLWVNRFSRFIQSTRSQSYFKRYLF